MADSIAIGEGSKVAKCAGLKILSLSEFEGSNPFPRKRTRLIRKGFLPSVVKPFNLHILLLW